jgi:hypothetical protein
MKFKKPKSQINLENVEPMEVRLTIRSLEKLAENMETEGYKGSATLVRQFGVALCEQELNRMEGVHRG